MNEDSMEIVRTVLHCCISRLSLVYAVLQLKRSRQWRSYFFFVVVVVPGACNHNELKEYIAVELHLVLLSNLKC